MEAQIQRVVKALENHEILNGMLSKLSLRVKGLDLSLTSLLSPEKKKYVQQKASQAKTGTVLLLVSMQGWHQQLMKS